jgi:hypothetical protein
MVTFQCIEKGKLTILMSFIDKNLNLQISDY